MLVHINPVVRKILIKLAKAATPAEKEALKIFLARVKRGEE